MSSYSFQGRTRVWVPRDEEENMKIFGSGRLDGIMPTIPVQQAPVDCDDYEPDRWPPTQLIKLLRLYGSHRCLWDLNDPFNKNRHERKSAMIDITEAMGENITMEMVAQKINVLRSTYRYEKRRIKQRIRKGLGARTKLKWFAVADAFLRNIPRAEKFRKSIDNQDSDSDLEDTVVFTIDPEILIPVEEDNAANQNFITIGDTVIKTENDPDMIEINEKVDKINKMIDKRRRHIRKSEMEDLKWTSLQSIQLVKFYRSHKCLWDTSDPSFTDIRKREMIIKQIVKLMDYNYSEKRILQKIKSIRSTYRKERKKYVEWQLKGESYKSKYKWYKLIDSFLRPFVSLKSINIDSERSADDKESDLDEENTNKNYNYSRNYNSPLMTDIKNEILTDDERREFKNETNRTYDDEIRIPKITIKPLKRKWTEKDSIQFVDLFHNNRCLWDVNDQNFSNQIEHKKSIADIAKIMDWPEDKIKKKIIIFRKAYQAERNKLEKAYRKGKSFKSELIWFTLADSFLGPFDHFTPVHPTVFVDPVLLNSPAANVDLDGDIFAVKNEINQITNNKSIKMEQTDAKLPLTVDNDQHGMNIEFSDNQTKVNSEIRQIGTLNPMVPEIKLEIENEHVPATTSNTDGLIKTPVAWQPPEDDLLEGKWTLKQSVKFLRIYGAHRCLWDLSDPDYRSRPLRQAAMEDIAAVMGHGLDAEFVSKKIKIFRITYMQERKRLTDLMRLGQDPEIQLKWFPLADCFLRPHIGLRAFKNNDPELPQFDFQFVYANLNLIDPELLNELEGKGTQNSIEIGSSNKGFVYSSSSEEDDEDEFKMN